MLGGLVGMGKVLPNKRPHKDRSIKVCVCVDHLSACGGAGFSAAITHPPQQTNFS